MNEYKTKLISTDSGGRDRILVAVESLSKKARRTYKAKTNEPKETNEFPWYTQIDFNWYKENNKEYFYQAIELVKYIEQYLNFDEIGRTEFANNLAKKLNIGTRTFHSRVKEYIEGKAWAEKLSEETGKNYDYFAILALCRKPRDKNTFPSLTDEVKVLIENIFYNKNFQQNNQPITNLYEDLEDIHNEIILPSYDTVLRYVNLLIESDGEGARFLVSKGDRAWKNKYMMKRKRDTKDLKVLEVLQGDVHTFDCWVSVKRPNGKLQAIKPCLVAWVDMRSRVLVGWAVAEHPDSQIIKKSLINAIYQKKNEALPYGVPRLLLIDNGKEYTAQTLTGRNRKVRVSLDADVKGYYRSIGIEDDIRSTPYEPWSKAQVERLFGTVCSNFTKRILSYTGTLSGEKTSAKVVKDISRMLEKNELLTIEEFALEFETWVVNKYHSRKHSGLKDQREDILIPIELFNTADRYYKAAPPLEYTLSLLMKSEERAVTDMGIKITREGHPIYYQSQDLSRHIGKRVDVRFHPDDITKVFVYDKEGLQICEAVSYELLKIASKLSEKAYIEHKKDQKRHLRGDRETIKFRQMTYEERLQHEKNIIENADKKIVTPELSKEVLKVTLLPDDQQYREEVKKRGRKPKKDDSNEYFEMQAAKALEKLKKLG